MIKCTNCKLDQNKDNFYQIKRRRDYSENSDAEGYTTYAKKTKQCADCRNKNRRARERFITDRKCEDPNIKVCNICRKKKDIQQFKNTRFKNKIAKNCYKCRERLKRYQNKNKI